VKAMQNKTLLMWQSVLAGLQVIAGASTLGDLFPQAKWTGLFVLIVAAFQVGLATWTQGLHTTPNEQPVVIAERGAEVSITAEAGKPGHVTTFGKHEAANGETPE
jgi:hypothetical protein